MVKEEYPGSYPQEFQIEFPTMFVINLFPTKIPRFVVQMAKTKELNN